MRNLKRALSLALAAAMLVSLMVVGASAASYGDEASISQNEAVEVLTGIGVVGGDQNGNFNPTATLTRAEFCVMIANALTGGTFDRTLFDGTTTPFTDVAGHWGAEYIAYCYSNGIVAGTSTTTFEPDSTLTAAQAAAILLMALGYNQNNEFAQNGQFALNVTRWAQQAGLYAGMSVSANAGISRENTAKLIFNALTNTTPVGYSSLAQSYYTVGTSSVNGVVFSGSQLDPKNPGSNNYVRTLGYTNFGLMKGTSATPDDFGRPSSDWGIDSNINDTTYAIGDVVTTVADTPVATFTAETKAADVATALSGYRFQDKDTATTYYAVNNVTPIGGSAEATTAVAAGSGTGNTDTKANFELTASQTIAKTIADLTKNGKLVEIYADNSNTINKIVTVTYTVAEVTNVTSNSTRTNYTFNNSVPSGIDYVDENTDDTIAIQGTIAKGDIVTVVKPASSTVLYVYPTTSVTGVQTAKTNDNKITISGTQYSIGEGLSNVKAADFNNSDNSAVYYIDQYGYVVETTSTAASTDYAFVIGVNGKLSTTVDGSTPSVEARVMLADGTVAVYDVAVYKLKDADVASGGDYASGGKFGDKASNNSSETWQAGDYAVKGTNICVYDKDDASANSAAITTLAKAMENVAFGYTMSSGSISLESLKDLTASGNAVDTVYFASMGNAVKSNTTSYTTVKYDGTSASDVTLLADKNTLFVVYNTDDKVATVYTGSTNLPKSIDDEHSNAGGTGYAVLKTDVNAGTVGTASVIFVTTSSGLTSDSTDNYVYIDATKYSLTRVNGEDKYVYTGTYANGTTITLSPSDKLAASGLYTYDEDNAVSDDNKLTASRYLGNAQAALAVTGDMLLYNGQYYNITENTQIVYLNNDLSEVNGNKGFVVLTVENGTDTKDVEAIFVTAD